MTKERRRAAFLDRDGTIIRDAEYLASPDGVELLDGAADAVRRLNEARIPVVVVTNQSGIARGYLDDDDFARVTARLDELLAAQHARIDATYMCPHHPDFDRACECRKPGTLLYRRAADALGLSLAGSWFVGDRWRDVVPAVELHGLGFLIESAYSDIPEVARSKDRIAVVPSLADAVTRIVNGSGHEEDR